MSWAEYTLRLIGYSRKEENNLRKIRRLAWFTFLAPYQDPKKLKRLTEDSFWQIGKIEKPKITDAQKERFLEANRIYLQKKKEKNGRT